MIKHKGSSSIARFILFLCLLCAFALSASCSFAESDSPGSGSGQNRDIALTLESCSLSDGQTDVAVDETIQLNFNKNICNITVLAVNKQCFHLTDEAGNPVAIHLIFPDNQVQQEYRRQVFIRPVSALEKHTRYKITVDRTLTAKNGTPIDNAHTLSFTTGTGKANGENAVLEALGENIITYETAYGETADSIPIDKSGLDEPAAEESMDTGTAARLGAGILVLIAAAFTVFLIMKRRRK